MKSKLLILALLVAVMEHPANAAITVEETTNAQYLRNNGYSALTTDIVNVSKSRATGKEYYTNDEIRFKNMNPVSRFFWRAYQYTDPAAEDYSFFHHDTKYYPVPTDL